MSSFLSVFVALFCAMGQELPAAPSGKEFREADRELRSLYKADLAEMRLLRRRAFGRRLLRDAADTAGMPNSRYALLLLAGQVSASCGDMVISNRAVTYAEARFSKVPGRALRAKFVGIARASCKKPVDSVALAGVCLLVVDECVAIGAFDQAAYWGAEANRAARESKSPAVVRRVTRAVEEMRGIQRLEMRVRGIRNPEPGGELSPRDALDAGLLFLLRGDDRKAFPLLLRSASKPIIAAVTEHLAKGDNPEHAERLAGLWVTAARHFKGASKAVLEKMGAALLLNALSSLAGVGKMRAEKHLDSIDSDGAFFFPAGKWVATHRWWGAAQQVVSIHSDGTFGVSNGRSGKWVFREGKLTVVWGHLLGATSKEVLDVDSAFRFLGSEKNSFVLTRQ